MIVAVGMVRDEADIIAPVVTQLLAQGVDRILVADNLSTDKTRSILDDLAARHPVTVLEDDEPGYYQSVKMSALAERAREEGATWVLPFDADEWWYGLDGTIAEVLADCSADVIKALGHDHLPSRSDPPLDNPVRRLGWRRRGYQTWPKVVFRAVPGVYLHMGNHDVEHPGARTTGLLEYRHYQYRSPEQMAHKVRVGKAAYEASTVHELHGTHWRRLGALSDEELLAEWEALLDEPNLTYDPAPMA